MSRYAQRLLGRRDIKSLGRALALARILCRPDIVQRLCEVPTVRGSLSQQPATRLNAMFRDVEGVFANKIGKGQPLNWLPALSVEQRSFLWAALSDAYIQASTMLRMRPSQQDIWAYTEQINCLNTRLGLTGRCDSPSDISRKIGVLIGRIDPARIPSGGWRQLLATLDADGLNVYAEDTLKIYVRQVLPLPLSEALCRD